LRVRARRAVLHQMREVLEPAGTRILDMGGGTGAATVVFGEGAAELVVLEPDPRRIRAGTKAHAPVTFVQGVAESVPYGEGRFDRVVSLMSFHHFAHGDRALAEASRVLAPGGRLVVVDFDPSTPRGRWISFFEGRLLHHPFVFSTPAELERRIVAASFGAVRRERLGSTALLVAER
ncbi:MAG: class I SAM-dependent methyltransferase, partial [Candidatus Lutacidiplasmatales archaeon]